MKKLLSILLIIIFFQSQVFSFPLSIPFLCFSNTTPNVKGALIASETDNLTLNTGKLVYSDIKDYDTQNGSSFGLSASLGQYDNDSTIRTGLSVDATGAKVTLKEQGKEKEQTTKATIGKETIIINNKEQKYC